MQGPSMKRPLEFGVVRTGPYILKSSFQYLKGFDGRAIDLSEQENSSCLSVSSTFPIPIKSSSDVRLWHLRLGHMPFQSMKNVCYTLVSPLHFHFDCNICHLARQTKLPFQSSEISTKKIFELIHIDTWGPYKTPSHDGYKYFLIIVDDYSRSTWLIF